jgi:phosphate/sulfate permease
MAIATVVVTNEVVIERLVGRRGFWRFFGFGVEGSRVAETVEKLRPHFPH